MKPLPLPEGDPGPRWFRTASHRPGAAAAVPEGTDGRDLPGPPFLSRPRPRPRLPPRRGPHCAGQWLLRPRVWEGRRRPSVPKGPAPLGGDRRRSARARVDAGAGASVGPHRSSLRLACPLRGARPPPQGHEPLSFETPHLPFFTHQAGDAEGDCSDGFIPRRFAGAPPGLGAGGGRGRAVGRGAGGARRTRRSLADPVAARLGSARLGSRARDGSARLRPARRVASGQVAPRRVGSRRLGAGGRPFVARGARGAGAAPDRRVPGPWRLARRLPGLPRRSHPLPTRARANVITQPRLRALGTSLPGAEEASDATGLRARESVAKGL